MGTLSQLGKVLILVGSLFILFGVVIVVAGKVPGVGRLPGDIYIKKGPMTFYFPLATSILISLILSLVISLFARK
jgi:hypothetical protein